MNLVKAIADSVDEIVEIRRDLHAHPELAFEEHRTADVVAKKLDAWGIPHVRGIGGTGIVGWIRKGSSDASIALRADMDALPVTEANAFAHASKHIGKMHACGHDGHTATLLAAARHLACAEDFHGTVYLIFQPAEEGGNAGARRMIEEGLFRDFKIDAVYGYHNWPGMNAGQVAVSEGAVMASGSRFNIVVRGKSGHAALPYTALDPMPAACHIVLALQTMVNQIRTQDQPVVATVTKIHGGEATNVISDTVTLEGTIRTFSNETLDVVEQRMRTLTEQIAAAHLCTCDFVLKRNYPPTINSRDEADKVRRAFANVVGESNVIEQRPVMGSEDFAFMLQEKPGAYLFLGNGDGTHRSMAHGEGPCTLHNSSYDFNDELIAIGASGWIELVRACLGQRI